MRTLEVSGRSVIVDDGDYEVARHMALFVTDHGYVRYFTRGGQKVRKKRYFHQFVTGANGRDGRVDHINGNKLDNRRENLRVVTAHENGTNRHKLNRNNRSGIRGVCFNKAACQKHKPWKATIYAHYRTMNLGHFATMEEAVAVRLQAEPLYFGEVRPEVSA